MKTEQEIFWSSTWGNKYSDRNSKTNYKFGLISINSKEYSWFFYGKIVAKNRVDALQTYNALLSYCTKNNLGQPFAFKDI